MPSFINNLISIGQFCDAGCKVVFTNTNVSVVDTAGTVVLQGFREISGARMWRFNIFPTPQTAGALTATTASPSLPHMQHVIPVGA